MINVYCPECVGMCECSEILLEKYNNGDDCIEFLKCPRCRHVFNLIRCEEEEDEDELSELHKNTTGKENGN